MPIHCLRPLLGCVGLDGEEGFLLRACTRSVERLVGRGELPVVRVGRMPRISRVTLMQFIERASGTATATPEEDGDGQRGF